MVGRFSTPLSSFQRGCFITSIDSMSLGLISLKLGRTMPSTIIRGDPEPSKLVPPRRIIRGVAPGSPLDWITRSPETAPERACAGFAKIPFDNVSLVTFEMELVDLLRN